MPNKSNKLKSAKRNKKDEFYTRYEDIEKELSHYPNAFCGKTVYCNCDDPTKSNFVKYFREHFDELGLKRLIATCWKGTDGLGTAWKLDTDNDGLTQLTGDGDFRSEECIELLKEADIVVTNPPFSLFREHLKQLIQHEKRFLVIGDKNVVTHKEVFPLFKENKIWIGVKPMAGGMKFIIPQGYIKDAENRLGALVKGIDGQIFGCTPSTWFTNLTHNKPRPPMVLSKAYTPEDYPTYDNYDAVDVSRTANIPEDYGGVMGVPISFLDKYNPDQFEIIGLGNGRKHFTPTKDYINPIIHHEDGTTAKGNEINRVLAIATKTEPVGRIYYTSDNSDYLIALYARILIRRRPDNPTEHPHNAT